MDTLETISWPRKLIFSHFALFGGRGYFFGKLFACRFQITIAIIGNVNMNSIVGHSKRECVNRWKCPNINFLVNFPPIENILFAKIPSFVIFVINHQKINSQLNFYFFSTLPTIHCVHCSFLFAWDTKTKIIAHDLSICGTNQKHRIFISDDNMLVLLLSSLPP